ncbi:MAG: hypothetical protein HOP12_02570 [Candidatus Eisenbacteria bacterium]|uniref:Glycosyl hydrolase family 32 N-terminal domain-containing protein n=1 Tax=Eiseniibacteriota bacterium TaxID=2212470 RepID=A0A849SHJ6_UNCEI|nr:hypothetical protein [Candidatus Eisenbacteria bacterium]
MRKWRTFVVVMLAWLCGCGSDTGRPPIPARVGVDWRSIAGNPILLPGPCPSWNCLGAGDPALASAPTGSLLLWATTGGDQGGPVIARASADPGLSFDWSPAAPVIGIAMAGAWDRFIETPSLSWDTSATRWRMFYLGYRDSGFVEPAIGMMFSGDSAGIQWTRPALPIYRPTPGAWDGVFVTGPCGVRGPDGVWRVYYTGAGTTVGIGLLTSLDGLTWAPHPQNPVFERRLGAWDESVLEPCVRHVDGRWHLWYSGFVEPLAPDTRIAIGHAISNDGVTWVRDPDGPVLSPGFPGSWNDLRVLSPDVLQRADGSLLLAAYGFSNAAIGTTVGWIGLWESP